MTSAVAPRRTLPLDLYVMAGARTMSVLGNGIMLTAMMLYLHDTGAGGWAVAALLAVGSAPMVLAAPVVGMMVDRYDSRTLIVASGLWQAAACVLLTLTGSLSIILLLVLVSTLGAAITMPVFAALTPLVASGRHLAAATGVQQGSHHTALLIGPAIGGMLTGVSGGARLPLLVAALAFVVSITAGGFIAARRQPGDTDGETGLNEGVAVLFRDRPIAIATALSALVTLTTGTPIVASVFLVRDVFQSSALVYGLLQGTYPVGVLIGIAVATRLHTVRRILLGSPLATVVMAVCVAGIGLSHSLAGVFVLNVMAGIGGGTAATAAMTIVLLRSPEAATGRVLAALSGLLRAVALAAYGLGGLLLGQLTPGGVYLSAGIAAMVVLLVTAPALRKAQPHRT
jgi:MFS family permease